MPAVKISNTISDLFNESMILNHNSLEILKKIHVAMQSKEDYVDMTLTNPNDEIDTTYLVPSFGYLKRSIDRLDTTLKTIMNLDGKSDSRVVLESDGTFRKIQLSKIPTEAPSITTIDKVENFNIKSNWFFEDLLNPCLYVSLDLSNSGVSFDTERVLVQRVILTCDTTQDVNYFNDSLVAKSGNIDYSTFVKDVLEKDIKFIVDEDIRVLPPRSKRYTGTFTVNEVSTYNAYSSEYRKVYKFDKTTYSDSRASQKDTKELKVGDLLETTSPTNTVVYKVVGVTDNGFVLDVVNGVSDGLTKDSQLKIYSEQDTNLSIEIPVGYNEREVVFIKPIDPISNIPAVDWSPGVAFFTNTLKHKHGDTETTLADFYKKYVIDFGQVILSYAKDYYPSVREGIKPEPPVLVESNFRVVQTNPLVSTTNLDTLSQLISDKSTIVSELENTKNKISTFSLSNGNEEDLSDMYDTHTELSKSYTEILKEIDELSQPVLTATPTYRVRGFWEVPEPKQSNSTGPQHVIRFKVLYTYLDTNGNGLPKLSIPITTQSGVSVEGVYSNWMETLTTLRKRIEKDDEYVWEEVDMGDGDTIKFNQLDIPIEPGQQVLIKVISMSEAGWPSNPIESIESNTIKISYDDFVETNLQNIIHDVEQNKIDLAVSKYINTL